MDWYLALFVIDILSDSCKVPLFYNFITPPCPQLPITCTSLTTWFVNVKLDFKLVAIPIFFIYVHVWYNKFKVFNHNGQMPSLFT